MKKERKSKRIIICDLLTVAGCFVFLYNTYRVNVIVGNYVLSLMLIALSYFIYKGGE